MSKRMTRKMLAATKQLREPPKTVKSAVKVLAADGLPGHTTGGVRPCTLEGCGGHKIGVRWSDGKITWPCIKGMRVIAGVWTIISGGKND